MMCRYILRPSVFVAMEFVDGYTLRDWLDEKSRSTAGSQRCSSWRDEAWRPHAYPAWSTEFQAGQCAGKPRWPDSRF